MKRVRRVRRDVSQETLLRLAYKAKKSPEALQVLQDALAETYPRMWTNYTEIAEIRATRSRSKWYVLFNPRQAILRERRRAKKKIATSHSRRVVDWSLDPLQLVSGNELMVRLKFSSRTMDFTSNDNIIRNPNKYLTTIFDSHQGSIIAYASRRGRV